MSRYKGKSPKEYTTGDTSIHFKDDTTHNSFKITEYILSVNVKEQEMVY